MKKIVIILTSIICVLAVILGFLYTIDMYKMKNNEPVLFSSWGYDYAPPVEMISAPEEIIKKVTTEEFELSVVESREKILKEYILNNKDLNESNSDYNLYYYGLEEVNVLIDDSQLTLEEALKSGMITLDGLITKANNDANKEENQTKPHLNYPIVTQYKDGGTTVYAYKDYTIIKMHTLDGDRDVYIGTRDMSLSIINKYKVEGVWSADDNYIIVDETIGKEDLAFATALEKIYEDSNYTYYFSVIKSQYVKVRYSDGKVENIISALSNNSVSISDLDKFGIGYLRYEKEVK